ncbi:flagellar biosynthetic protein FliO [Oscillibacter valericigenes Sjm18-20]|nr:flagellar biosynthetic protein FliO [Oscillibacter valericigenes Sjm18-20]
MPWTEIGTLLGMLAAVVVILLLAWLFTRYLAGRTPGAMRFSRNRNGKLQLLERMPLGREQYLAVVRAGETYLLLGVTGSQITLLRELSAQEASKWTEDETDTPPESTPGEAMPFRDALREVWKQRKK